MKPSASKDSRYSSLTKYLSTIELTASVEIHSRPSERHRRRFRAGSCHSFLKSSSCIWRRYGEDAGEWPWFIWTAKLHLAHVQYAPVLWMCLYHRWTHMTAVPSLTWLSVASGRLSVVRWTMLPDRQKTLQAFRGRFMSGKRSERSWRQDLWQDARMVTVHNAHCKKSFLYKLRVRENFLASMMMKVRRLHFNYRSRYW